MYRSAAVKSIPEERQHDCAVCDAEESFVLYDGDKMCANCNHAPESTRPRDDGGSAWRQWWEHRRDEYSGFTGSERVKLVGGFASSYDFEDDF